LDISLNGRGGLLVNRLFTMSFPFDGDDDDGVFAGIASIASGSFRACAKRPRSGQQIRLGRRTSTGGWSR
jgi:hypothetical protein